MTKSHRYITSLFMTALYLLIVFSPLAPFAMQSKLVAHAVTGECSGDCKIDGCSLERSAAHACCCWQKKQHAQNNVHLHPMTKAVATPPEPPTKSSRKKSSCCYDQAADSRTNKSDAASASASPATPSTEAVTITSTPCGSGKLFDLLNSEQAQHIPFIFVEVISSPEQTTLAAIPPGLLTSRQSDPPDPPPIIS
jgi:hypothetical protein